MRAVIGMVLLSTYLFAMDVVPYAGIAMNGNMKGEHSTTYVDSESPIGVFGVDAQWKYGSVGYRHVSSIPLTGPETQGINEVIGIAQYKWFYTGVAYNGRMTSSYYTKQISTVSTLVGIDVDYGDKSIFVEYRDSEKKDMLMYGIKIKFKGEDLLW
jgi:hypothetical protein